MSGRPTTSDAERTEKLLDDFIVVLCAHVPGADASRVQQLMGHCTRLRGFLDVTEAALVRRADDLAAQGNGADGTDLSRQTGRRSSRTARKGKKRAGTLGSTPKLGQSLGEGEVSSDHIDEVTKAADNLPPERRDEFLDRADDELVDAARTQPVESFAKTAQRLADEMNADDGVDKLTRQKQRTSLSTWVNKSGMGVLNGEFDPETFARITTALQAEYDSLHNAHANNELLLPEGVVNKAGWLRAQALANLVSGARSSTARIPELLVLIDWKALQSGSASDARRPTRLGNTATLPVATARRLACESSVIPVVLGGNGELLDVGRAHRTATRAQRRALRALYDTCMFCDTRFDWCQIHHFVHWSNFGPTDLHNLGPVCNQHHHLLHEGSHGIVRNDDLTLSLVAPNLGVRATTAVPHPCPPNRCHRVASADDSAANSDAAGEPSEAASRPGRRLPDDKQAQQSPLAFATQGRAP